MRIGSPTREVCSAAFQLFLHAGQGMLRLIGLGIVIARLGLMLPLPIPFSNNIPAWAIVLLAIGMMEKDGLCVLLGHLTAIFSWVFPCFDL